MLFRSHLATTTGDAGIRALADTLDRATATLLDENKSPADDVGTIDNRGSHFSLALYWAQELSRQTTSPDLKAVFTPLAEQLSSHEAAIEGDLTGAQGHEQDLAGHYLLSDAVLADVMRPSSLLNEIVDSFGTHQLGAPVSTRA